MKKWEESFKNVKTIQKKMAGQREKWQGTVPYHFSLAITLY